MGQLTFLAANGLGLSESFFVATNATVGTGIATPASGVDTVTATAAETVIYNAANASSGDNQWVVPLYYRLKATTANTNATNFRIAQVLDNVDRYTSGGTTLTSKSSAVDTRNGYTSRTPKARIDFGVLVTTAASSAQVIGNTALSDAVLVDDETLEIVYGDQVPGGNKDTSNSMVCVPVWIGRQCSLVYHHLAPSQTVDAEFEVEIAFAELGHPKF